MSKDKYTAIWVSHSSIGDFLKCPRGYYLKNVYKSPKTNKKMSIMSPALALGQTIHEVVESLSVLPVEDRLKIPLLDKYNLAWAKVAGEKGGFKDDAQEQEIKARGVAMLNRITQNPGPILKKAVKIRQDLPYFWLSDEDNIILCGKIDWLEYVAVTDSVSILDFKTGKYDEDPGSLQLPIYLQLVSHCQDRPVTGAAYWYLDRDAAPKPVALPDPGESYKKILTSARRVAEARKLKSFECPKGDGCRDCRDLELAAAGKAKFVGLNDFGQEVYITQQ